MTAPAVDPPDALSRLIPSRVLRGFVLAVLAGLLFTGLNASAKELTTDLPPLFVSWGRWVAGVMVIVPAMLWHGGVAGMATRSFGMHCFRGIFHVSGYALWYEAVAWLPLATMAAIGFAGMLVVVRPGIVDANYGTWAMLAAVPLIAGSNLVAKAVSSRDSPAVVVFWQTMIATVAFTPFGIWLWHTPSLAQLALFLSAGAFGTVGYFLLTWAFRLLDISAIQPITFLGIVWAALMDVAVWGKTSDIWTFVGAAIIVGSTSYIAHREARVGSLSPPKPQY